MSSSSRTGKACACPGVYRVLGHRGLELGLCFAVPLPAVTRPVGDGPLQGGLPLPPGDNPSPAPLTFSDKTLTQTGAFLCDIFLLINQGVHFFPQRNSIVMENSDAEVKLLLASVPWLLAAALLHPQAGWAHQPCLALAPMERRVFISCISQADSRRAGHQETLLCCEAGR